MYCAVRSTTLHPHACGNKDTCKRGLASSVPRYTLLIAARQFDERDLAAHAETRRRAPVAGAAAHVQHRVIDAMQTRDDRLEPSDQQIEWKELSAVRMSGKLQVDAVVRCGLRNLRTMREQNLERMARRVRERANDIALTSDRIGDAGDDEIVANDAMLILKECHTEALEFFNPFGGAPVVLVISCDDEDAVACAKIAQRLDGVAKIVDVPIDQIAGDDDRIGIELVRAANE